MTTAIVVLLGALLMLNIAATTILVRSSRYESGQKWMQAAIVWLLPAIGAVLVWSLAKDSPSERVTTDLRDRGGNDDGHIRLDSYSSGGASGHESD